ncbi:hypothetical protein HanIR_Chr07g0307571 [Helianthus annuus]|nr:hypothetical protein HanIR_Chr07g0307571 [Helianthus annuus]
MLHVISRFLTRLNRSSLMVLREQLVFFNGSRALRILSVTFSVLKIARSSFLRVCFRRGLLRGGTGL